jgi:uncharacterized protein YkwD
LRNVLAAALAVPVIAIIVARGVGQRAGARRLTAIAAVLALGAIVALSSTRPTPTSATLPTRVSAYDASEFATEIQTSSSPSAPVLVSFPARMNAASVEGLLSITPKTGVSLSWDQSGSLLTVTPRTSWAPGTYYTVTVEAGALDDSGRPLERRIRAAFLTRPPITATVTPTVMAGTEATTATTFRLEFSGPVDDSTLDVLISPPVEGTLIPIAGLTRVTGGSGVSDTAPAYEFVPADPLQPATTYEVRLAPGTRDVDGAAIEASVIQVTTAAAPAVIRFRPRNNWAAVNWNQDLSVRFSEPMDRASTEAAWSATQGSKNIALTGTFTWAEGDTVLVFDPKTVLGYSQKVTMVVGTGATSKAGLPLQAAAGATFSTAARPAPRPTGGGGGSSGGGGSIGGSTWAAVETYYLRLMNCTRTGGWVTSTGSCSSPGGRAVAALWQDAGISSKVSRPYAKKLAVNGLCTHFSGGNPGDRLRAAGYTSYIWAENLGCRSGDPYSAVLGSHLYFQSEKSYSGGHYVNLMNAKYDRVGLGVWVSGGRVRLVVDFYHPL